MLQGGHTTGERRSRTWYFHGDETVRFWGKVDRSNPEGCWPWLDGQHGEGYGSFKTSRPHRESWLSHRYAWELTNGPIPAGMHLHHTCENRACCNPSHLRPMTNSEHRSLHMSGRPLATRCHKGHELGGENAGPPSKPRECRVCKRERNRLASIRYREKKRARA